MIDVKYDKLYNMKWMRCLTMSEKGERLMPQGHLAKTCLMPKSWMHKWESTMKTIQEKIKNFFLYENAFFISFSCAEQCKFLKIIFWIICFRMNCKMRKEMV